MTNIFLRSILIGFVCLHISQTALCQDYDKERFDKIKSDIAFIIKNKKRDGILKMPFDEVEKMLSLKEVAWDKGYSSKSNSEVRIYHFRGFYLILFLEKRMPNDPPTWTNRDLAREGILYLYYFHPGLLIDGLNDAEARMKIYQEKLNESFRKRNEEFQRQKNQSKPEN